MPIIPTVIFLLFLKGNSGDYIDLRLKSLLKYWQTLFVSRLVCLAPEQPEVKHYSFGITDNLIPFFNCH